MPIVCTQHNPEKVIPTEEDILKSDWNGMGNKVGSITNKITAMMETQSNFKKNTPEWLELERRILSGQHLQQGEIDRIKGVIAKPMPPYWYNISAARKMDDFQVSICTHKKPYFMTYVYEDYRREYKKYADECNISAFEKFNKSYDELSESSNPEYADFLEYVRKRNPFGMGLCSMNRICFYIEKQFAGLVSQLKKNSNFDYKVLLYDIPCENDELFDELWKLSLEYKERIRLFKSKNKYNIPVEELNNQRKRLRRDFQNAAKHICQNDALRFNIILEICYKYDGYKQFCWDCIGDMIVNRLEELDL